jgi:hypothetical protein
VLDSLTQGTLCVPARDRSVTAICVITWISWIISNPILEILLPIAGGPRRIHQRTTYLITIEFRRVFKTAILCAKRANDVRRAIPAVEPMCRAQRSDGPGARAGFGNRLTLARFTQSVALQNKRWSLTVAAQFGQSDVGSPQLETLLRRFCPGKTSATWYPLNDDEVSAGASKPSHLSI